MVIRFVPLLLAVMLLAGCLSQEMRQLDDDVARMIRQRQQEALGVQNINDRQPVEPATADSKVGPRGYQTHLSSENPPVSALPAAAEPAGTQPATATQPTRAPATASIWTDPAATQPGALTLNLEQALAQAIAGSRTYRNRKEELFLAALDLLIEKHLWGPRFFDTVTAQVSGAPEAGDHDQVLTLLNDLGVTQRLPYGGTVSAHALVDYTRLVQNAGDQIGGNGQNATVGVSLLLPLLRGAGESAREELIQAHRTLVYQTRSFEQYRRQFLVDISSSYYSLIQQQSGIDNLARQVKNYEWLYSRTEALASAGRLPFFEVQRAQQQVLFARNDLLNAQESYSSAVDAFKVALGLPVDGPLAIVPSEVVVPAPVLNAQEAIVTGLQYRLDLQNALDQVDDARRQAQVAKNQLLPDLDVFGDLNLPTDPERRIGALNLRPGVGTYDAGVRLSLPLDRRNEQLGYRKALVNVERAQRSWSLLVDQVTQQVRNSLRQIEQAQFTLELQNRNIQVADRRLRGVLLRIATLGIRDFIEAQSDLLEARTLRDAALRDLRVAILQYLLDTGQLRVDSRGQWLPPVHMLPLATTAPAPATDVIRLMNQP